MGISSRYRLDQLATLPGRAQTAIGCHVKRPVGFGWASVGTLSVWSRVFRVSVV